MARKWNLFEENLGKLDSASVESLLDNPVLDQQYDAILYRALINACTKSDRLDLSMRLLKTVLREDPRDQAAIGALAMLLAEAPGKQHQALRLVDRALVIAEGEDTPSYEKRVAPLWDIKGVALLNQGQATQAIKWFQLAATSAPHQSLYHLHLAACHGQIGNVSEAEDCYQRALRNGLPDQSLRTADQSLVDKLRESLRFSAAEQYSSSKPRPRESYSCFRSRLA